MNPDTTNIFISFKSIGLKNKDFLPKQIAPFKSVQLNNLFILFNPSAEENFIVFDLQEKQFLPVKLSGDKLLFLTSWSICPYRQSKIIIYGANRYNRDSTIGFLYIHRELNEVQIKFERFISQDGPVSTSYSANVVGKHLILYGGSINSMDTLTTINLETFLCETKATFGKSKPGRLLSHESLVHDDKLYIYGGQSSDSGLLKQNFSVWTLDLVKYEWEKLTDCPKAHTTAQIDKDYMYFFGDKSNHFSIFNLKKKMWHQVIKKEGGPVAESSYTSALYNGRMIIFGEKSPETKPKIYSVVIEDRPLSNHIRETDLQMEFSEEDNRTDVQSLSTVQSLLKDPDFVSDVVFKVQEKEFPANKEILSLRSTFFSNMFSSGMRESHEKEIPLTDISKKAFGALLEYFYHGILPSEEGVIKELLEYSEKILLKRLEVYCEKALLDC